MTDNYCLLSSSFTSIREQARFHWKSRKERRKQVHLIFNSLYFLKHKILRLVSFLCHSFICRKQGQFGRKLIILRKGLLLELLILKIQLFNWKQMPFPPLSIPLPSIYAEREVPQKFICLLVLLAKQFIWVSLKLI